MDLIQLKKLTTLIRYYILLMSTAAGSGHPTSSLSAADIMTGLFFQHFRFDLDNPDNMHNDRLIFSKGHASPLFYALYAAAGKITEKELLKYRTFESNLEGHPTPRFAFTEAATGSLGQGLSIGVGEALAMRMYQVEGRMYYEKNEKIPNTSYILPNTTPKAYVLLGDGEMAEGSVWEAIQYAAYNKLDNLIAVLDVNGLGQSAPTMVGHNIDAYAHRIAAFGWRVLKLPDGHDPEVIHKAFVMAQEPNGQPTMIIAHTVKGKGISFLESKEGWHGKALSQEESKKAIAELGVVDKTLRGEVRKPENMSWRGVRVADDAAISTKSLRSARNDATTYKADDQVATRKAFGNVLASLGENYPDVIVLDGDVQNSTYTELFAKAFPERFLQVYIAEQNMLGVALGLWRRGLTPVVSTFSSFITRAHDQIRMAALSGATILVNGSHAGVSIGEDGPSQMGLEDISLFRTVFESTVIYPADAVATEQLTAALLNNNGISYIRTSRPNTPVLYKNNDQFKIGGSVTLKSSAADKVTLVAAGITVFEALKAQKILAQENIAVRVIDCYSIKPIDIETLKKAAAETKVIITVEDHYAQGGLGDAVLEALAEKPVPVYKLAVTKTPRSGKPAELLAYEEIDAAAIVKKVKSLL